MNLVYTTDAKEFEPVSVGSNYLYHEYDKVNSFLHRYYKGEFSRILAKPVLSNQTVQWYADFNASLSRLSDLSKNVQDNVLNNYWTTKHKLKDEIDKLSRSSESEKKKWATILSEVFNEDNNIILSDGNEWCLLWGWKYNNKRENYIPPNFVVPIPVDPLDQRIKPEEEIPNDRVDEPIEDENIPIIVPPVMPLETEENSSNNNENEPQKKKKSHFWYRVKRFFRNFVYRYWALLLLIMLILLIICLCKKCNRDNCNENEDLKQRLIELEDKARERCD
jgi:hypothetical protein